MRVAHINTLVTGGAAIAARGIHDSLVDAGVESSFYHLHGEGPNQTYGQPCRQTPLPGRLLRRLRRMMLERKVHQATAATPEGYELFSYGRAPCRSLLAGVNPRPDIVHLHWVSGFVDYPTFFSSLGAAIPIVWTLHDMNPLTGGCHYAWECTRYYESCHDCSQLGKRGSNDLSARTFAIKQRALQGKNLHVAADSYWLEAEAGKSAIMRGAKSIRTIHYGLDTAVFSPRSKAACKTALGIDPSVPVVAFGAHGVTNRRKGMHLLLAALEQVSDTHEMALLVFGGSLPTVRRQQRLAIYSLGSVNRDILPLVYSAADVFVIPSLHEAFGQTALEAMACGTPVVGFDVGGIPDMVRPGETGLLAKPGDPQDLAAKIRWILDHPDERRQMGANARKVVEQEFTLELQAKRYIELYNEILQGNSPH